MSTPSVITAIRCLTTQSHMSYASCSCFVCLEGHTNLCIVLEQFKFGSLSTILSYWPLDVQHATSRQRSLWGSEKRNAALHKDGWDYKKFSNSLEQSYSTVARVIQRFSETGFTRNRPRKGRSKKSSPCAVHQVQKLASKNRRLSAFSIALEVAEVHRSACQC